MHINGRFPTVARLESESVVSASIGLACSVRRMSASDISALTKACASTFPLPPRLTQPPDLIVSLRGAIAARRARAHSS